MEPTKLAELEATATAAVKAAEEAGGTDETLNASAESAKQAFETAKALSQDPVKAALEREKRKEPRTEAEKAAFALKKNAERARELGLDPASVLGIESAPLEGDDNAPVTVAMLKKIEADKAQKTALQLADDITNENERELTKHYIQTRIVPSGNPQEDYRMALAIVNSVKNGQIAEEVARKGTASSFSGSGAPAKPTDGEFIPTAEEAALMRPPFNLSLEKVKEARQKTQQ